MQGSGKILRLGAAKPRDSATEYNLINLSGAHAVGVKESSRCMSNEELVRVYQIFPSVPTSLQKVESGRKCARGRGGANHGTSSYHGISMHAYLIWGLLHVIRLGAGTGKARLYRCDGLDQAWTSLLIAGHLVEHFLFLRLHQGPQLGFFLLRQHGQVTGGLRLLFE